MKIEKFQSITISKIPMNKGHTVISALHPDRQMSKRYDKA